MTLPWRTIRAYTELIALRAFAVYENSIYTRVLLRSTFLSPSLSRVQVRRVHWRRRKMKYTARSFPGVTCAGISLNITRETRTYGRYLFQMNLFFSPSPPIPRTVSLPPVRCLSVVPRTPHRPLPPGNSCAPDDTSLFFSIAFYAFKVKHSDQWTDFSFGVTGTRFGLSAS